LAYGKMLGRKSREAIQFCSFVVNAKSACRRGILVVFGYEA